jgi:hypothetical protein
MDPWDSRKQGCWDRYVQAGMALGNMIGGFGRVESIRKLKPECPSCDEFQEDG